jgi:cation:H+ antiporter
MLLFSAAMLGGLVLLAVASDQFVAGSSRIATALRVSPVVIGAVVIGAGTSLPELLVSGSAALRGQPDIAMGNVVGSTVANLTLVLGAAALFGVLPVSRGTLLRQAPLSVAGVLALAAVLFGSYVSRIEGALLLVGVVVAFWLLVRPDIANPPEGGAASPIGLGPESLRTVAGLVGTLAGANMMVWGAGGAADEFGLSEGFVGLTLVALGTSLPELFTAVQAARQGSTDLILGNVLGSNMFNCLAIGGAVAVIAPGEIDSRISLTGSVAMVVAAMVVMAMMRSGYGIHRREGVLLLAGYAVLVPVLLA